VLKMVLDQVRLVVF